MLLRLSGGRLGEALAAVAARGATRGADAPGVAEAFEGIFGLYAFAHTTDASLTWSDDDDEDASTAAAAPPPPPPTMLAIVSTPDFLASLTHCLRAPADAARCPVLALIQVAKDADARPVAAAAPGLLSALVELVLDTSADDTLRDLARSALYRFGQRRDTQAALRSEPPALEALAAAVRLAVKEVLRDAGNARALNHLAPGVYLIQHMCCPCCHPHESGDPFLASHQAPAVVSVLVSMLCLKLGSVRPVCQASLSLGHVLQICSEWREALLASAPLRGQVSLLLRGTCTHVQGSSGDIWRDETDPEDLRYFDMVLEATGARLLRLFCCGPYDVLSIGEMSEAEADALSALLRQCLETSVALQREFSPEKV